MKLRYLAFSVILFFMACNGADYEVLSDDYCYIVANHSEVINEDCRVNFIFEDEDGNEYEWNINPHETLSTIISLPKNKCYDAWVTSGQCDNAELMWDILQEGNPCFTLNKDVSSRPEVYDEAQPHYSFCLDDECNCAEVTEH